MNRISIRIISLLIVSATVLSLFSCRKLETPDEESQPFCAKTESVTLTVPMFSYYYNAYIRNYLAANSEVVRTLGFDAAKSPDSQEYSDGITWQDYFLSQLKPMLSLMLSMATAAKKEGIVLTDEDRVNIGKEIETHKETAKEAGKSADEYAAVLYGEGVDTAVMEQCLKIRYLANTYQNGIETPDFSDMTDESCESLFKGKPDGMLHYDCIKITVPPEDTEELMKATDVESFETAMADVITKNNFGGDYENNVERIQKMISAKTYVKEKMIKGTKISDWAFEEDRKPYDICTVAQTSGDITVAMILPSEGEPGKYNDVLYRDERPTYTVKTVSYKDGKAAENDYSDLIYSDNISSFFAENDGTKEVVTLENISRSEVDGALREWVFAEGREPGDIGCIEVSDDETVIVLVDSVGDPSWKNEAKEIASEDFRREFIEDTMKKYPSEFNDEGIRAVKYTVFA